MDNPLRAARSAPTPERPGPLCHGLRPWPYQPHEFTMTDPISLDFSRVAQDLQIRKVQVESVVQLLDEGNTVPFITRYRKERTGGLNEDVIRRSESRVATDAPARRPQADHPQEHRGSGQAHGRAACRDHSPPRRPSGWKTCICPTSPRSAAWRPPPARRAWNRWPWRSGTATRPWPTSTKCCRRWSIRRRN